MPPVILELLDSPARAVLTVCHCKTLPHSSPCVKTSFTWIAATDPMNVIGVLANAHSEGRWEELACSLEGRFAGGWQESDQSLWREQSSVLGESESAVGVWEFLLLEHARRFAEESKLWQLCSPCWQQYVEAKRRWDKVLFAPQDQGKFCARHTCCMCGALAKSHCSKCKEAVYCSSKCQTANWPKHKTHCHLRSKLPADSKQASVPDEVAVAASHGNEAEPSEVPKQKKGKAKKSRKKKKNTQYIDMRDGVPVVHCLCDEIINTIREDEDGELMHKDLPAHDMATCEKALKIMDEDPRMRALRALASAKCGSSA